MTTTCQWGVLLSEHQRHKLVREGLVASGTQYFLPLIEDTTIVNGRHIHTKRPLLGRYVFFIINDAWKSLLSLRGVYGMLLNVEKNFPAQVDDGALDAIRSMCSDGIYSKRAVATKNGFVYGQRVTPQSGPLAAQVGYFDGIRSRQREVAVFNIFGREQRVTFKSGELVAA